MKLSRISENINNVFLSSPVIKKKIVLDEQIKDEIDKTLHSHTEEILPHKVPSEWIHGKLLPCAKTHLL